MSEATSDQGAKHDDLGSAKFLVQTFGNSLYLLPGKLRSLLAIAGLIRSHPLPVCNLARLNPERFGCRLRHGISP
jgi:hypothetical protein